MSSACTCHIKKSECKFCNYQVIETEHSFVVTDRDNDRLDLETTDSRGLLVNTVDSFSDKSACVVLNQKQIKHLMLFLDRKYGYLLEGVK